MHSFQFGILLERGGRAVARKREKYWRRLVRRFIYDASSTATLGNFGRILLAYLRRRSGRTKALPLVSYSAASEPIGPVAEATEYTVSSPRRIEQGSVAIQGAFPAIEARAFSDATAAAYSAAIITQGSVAIPDYYCAHPNATVDDGRFLHWHSCDRIAICTSGDPRTAVSNGIMLFGRGTNNWYHWLIETLPCAFMANRLQELSDVPFVVPAKIMETPTFRQSLAIFLRGRKVLTIGSDPVRFDKLVVIGSPVNEPINLRKGCWPTEEDYGYNPEVLQSYRAALLQSLGIEDVDGDDRIFLARATTWRSYNQDELINIAQSHGFRVVYPERLSFREQAKLMLRARAIVGPSGAAFANMIFCRPGTQIMSWVPTQYGGFCSYANLAAVTGAKLSYLFVRYTDATDTTADGARAAYQVNPAAFQELILAAHA